MVTRRGDEKEDTMKFNSRLSGRDTKICLALCLFLMVLVWMAGIASASTDSMNISPDKDTLVCEDFETTNYGSDNMLAVGAYYGGERRRTGLLTFTIPAAPNSGDKIVGINLYLYYYNNLPSSENDDYIEAHELLEDFSEMEATWNERETGISWSTPGALPLGSSSSTIIDSIFLEGGTKDVWKTLTLKGDNADNPVNWDWSEEHKIMLTTSGEYGNSLAYYFYSNQAVQYNPYLEIIYGDDTTPPIISNVANIDISFIVLSQQITWQTDEPATSLIKYGTEPGNYIYQNGDTTKLTEHNLTIDGLSADTTYYFIVSSSDIFENSAQSSEFSFTTSGSKSEHPFLLFENISETPGYQHRTEAPWSTWEASIISSANSALSKDFEDAGWRMVYQAEAARNLALAYQITKDTTYAEKAKEALLNLDIANVPYKVSKIWGIRGYSLAYDWVQPYLDAESDSIIRDKLATLADQAYYDLNDGGTDMDYIAFSDYHGQAYPIMGIAGCVLFDYNNPNNLPLATTTSDWVNVGTEYLFEDDPLHSYNKSLFSMAYDPAGMHSLNVDYKYYGLSGTMWWLQVYSHFSNQSIFEVYPAAKEAFTAELWETCPNRYQNNYCCGGNTKDYYHNQMINLLDDDYKAYMLNFNEIIVNSDILPYTRSFGVDTTLPYLVYGDYDDIQRKNPLWTSHVDTNSFFQVLRGGWNEDDDWLSLVTYNASHIYKENRNMAHHDQLGFEYYSKGDLLLADGGEDKHVLDRYYGGYGISHNTILIEDPGNPFDVGSWSDSRARGMYKGTTMGLITPVSIDTIVNSSWMESLEARTSVEYVIGSSWQYTQELSSPINYKRAVLYPNKDYFIVVDRLEGTEPWTYRNVFRPSSLSITPSIGTTEAEVGYVNGSLQIDDTAYDWLSLPYKTETDTGTTTNSIKWDTTNPYGNDVELHIFSAPSSEIRVTKHVTRIAGYNLESEVFLPLVYFRTDEPTNNLYRVTVLLSRYPSEEEKTPEDVPVSGTGNAVKVTASGYEDYIYAGKGASSFSDFSTDADTLYVRKAGQPSTFTFMNGTYVNYSDAPLFAVSEKVDYVSLKYEGENNRTFTIKGDGTAVDITLYGMNPSLIYQVKRDGVDYPSWGMTDGNTRMVIITDLDEHTFEIEAIGADGWTRPLTTTTITPSPAEDGWNNVSPVVVTFFRNDTSGSGISYTNYSKISASGPWTTVNTVTATGPDAGNVTTISEDKFNVPFLDEGVTTIWYYSVDSNTTPNVEPTKNVTVKVDTTPPASISNLQNTTGTTWINWTWTNPEDEDFSHTIVYLDGVFKTNISNPYYNATQLTSDTRYEICTRTVDTHGNVNTGWVNQTAKTSITNSNGALSGTITYANNGTGIAGVTVNLTENGTVIASTTTDSNGNYIITEVTSNDYIVTVSKIRFWSNSTPVTVNADETETAHLKLWVKGDLNNNGISADVGDQAMIKDASVGTITADWKYDLNTNGIFSDAGDLAMIKDASVGTIELL